MSWIRNNKYFLLGSLCILALLGFFTLTLKAQWVVDNINLRDTKSQEEIIKSFSRNGDIVMFGSLPEQDNNRLDILVAGMRGAGEGPGDFLTDTLMILSLDQTTGSAALISIPRDLYISFPYENKKRKINELYIFGYEQGGETLAFGLTKTMISQMMGIYIDGMVRVDFEGFKKMIDTAGGIDIYLDKPFVEITQWQGMGGFFLPAGQNHLNGERSLFYARSRFSSSDFDRAKRQHEILLALQHKVSNLGILSNPVKVYTILDIIGNHVKTDAGIDVPEALALANKIDYAHIKKLVLSTDNYLYHDTAPNGAYILLPNGGDFSQIKQAVQNILTTPLHEGSLNNPHPLQNSPTAGKSAQGTQDDEF